MLRQDIRPLSLKLVLPVLLAYGLVSAVGLYYHELFLDEAHHFLLARDSNNLYELYQNARYDGHPRLWHSLLYFITHYITRSVTGMQVFHWLITMAMAFVLLRYAPFSLGVKLLLLSGYYFLFEYDLLSRNYALGIFFLFLCCQLLRRPYRHLAGVGVLLFFMCSTHLFFTFAAIGIYAFVFIDQAREGKLATKPFLVFSGLFLAGFVCALIQARTPVEDNINMTPVNAAGFLSAGSLSFAAYGLVRGWLPVPQRFDGHFWNSYWLYKSAAGAVLRNIFFAGFLVFPFLLLRKDRKALLFYYTGVSLLLLFFSVTQMTASRYFGMVFIFFLAALWMMDPLATPAPLYLRICFYSILVVQSVVGVFALIQDIRLPFSESRHAVEFLEEKGVTGERLVVDGYNAGPMLSAYLGRKVFYLATGQEGSFCTWKKSYFPKPRPSIREELAKCSVPGPFILISNRDLDTAGYGRFRLTPLKMLANSIIKENFFIYQFQSLH